MMMDRLIDFAKIEATGNDFIFIDDRQLFSHHFSKEYIQKLCNRHTGIGADGLIRLSVLEDQKIGIRYFNADGSEGNMCGNGLRAAILFAYIIGWTRKDEICHIKAADGLHQGILKSWDQIKVDMFAHGSVQPVGSDALELPEFLKVLGLVNTGVPHLVLEYEKNLNKLDVVRIGKRLRNHLMFSPDGTNVNFIKRLSEKTLQVRTYERGVENETLSCGSGVTASALLYWHVYHPQGNDVQINTKGGTLIISRDHQRLFLQGPARIIFVGRIIPENKYLLET